MLAGKFTTEQEGKFTADLEHLRDAMGYLILLIFSNTHSSAPLVSLIFYVSTFYYILLLLLTQIGISALFSMLRLNQIA